MQLKRKRLKGGMNQGNIHGQQLQDPISVTSSLGTRNLPLQTSCSIGKLEMLISSRALVAICAGRGFARITPWNLASHNASTALNLQSGPASVTTPAAAAPIPNRIKAIRAELIRLHQRDVKSYHSWYDSQLRARRSRKLFIDAGNVDELQKLEESLRASDRLRQVHSERRQNLRTMLHRDLRHEIREHRRMDLLRFMPPAIGVHDCIDTIRKLNPLEVYVFDSSEASPAFDVTVGSLSPFLFDRPLITLGGTYQSR